MITNALWRVGVWQHKTWVNELLYFKFLAMINMILIEYSFLDSNS